MNWARADWSLSDLSGHPLFTSASARHPTRVWALLEACRLFEARLLGVYVPQLAAELSACHLRELADLVRGCDLDLALCGPMAAAVAAWRTPLAQTVSACAAYQLVVGSSATLRGGRLHARLGAYHAAALTSATMITWAAEVLTEHGLGGEGAAWVRTRGLIARGRADALERLPTLLADDPVLRACFLRGARRMTRAVESFLDAMLDAERARALGRPTLALEAAPVHLVAGEVDV